MPDGTFSNHATLGRCQSYQCMSECSVIGDDGMLAEAMLRGGKIATGHRESEPRRVDMAT